MAATAGAAEIVKHVNIQRRVLSSAQVLCTIRCLGFVLNVKGTVHHFGEIHICFLAES